MINYVQPGDVCTFTAPVGGVVSGNAYLIGSLFVVAAISALAGEEFEGKINGVFNLPKAAGALAEGAPAYWDNDAKVVTGTNTADRLIGAITKAALAGDLRVNVRLNAIAVV